MAIPSPILLPSFICATRTSAYSRPNPTVAVRSVGAGERLEKRCTPGGGEAPAGSQSRRHRR
jgi:hypothetical protein